MRRALILVATLFAAALGAACNDGPVRSFEKFYDELAAGDADAIERLSQRARAQLDDDARKALLITPPRASIKSVRVVHETDLGQAGKTATLEVVDVLGDQDEVRMVYEAGAWRVDL